MSTGAPDYTRTVTITVGTNPFFIFQENEELAADTTETAIDYDVPEGKVLKIQTIGVYISRNGQAWIERDGVKVWPSEGYCALTGIAAILAFHAAFLFTGGQNLKLKVQNLNSPGGAAITYRVFLEGAFE